MLGAPGYVVVATVMENARSPGFLRIYERLADRIQYAAWVLVGGLTNVSI